VAAVVVQEAVIAFVARTFKETIQTTGNIGRVVDVAVGIAVVLAAYRIDGG